MEERSGKGPACAEALRSSTEASVAVAEEGERERRVTPGPVSSFKTGFQLGEMGVGEAWCRGGTCLS